MVLEPPAGGREDGVVPDLLFLRVPEGRAGKNRLHLDLRPVDQAAEVARLEEHIEGIAQSPYLSVLQMR